MAALFHERDNTLAAVAPLLVRPWRWQCRLGWRKVVSFDVRTARFLGRTPLAPVDASGLERLIATAAEAADPFDILQIEAVDLDSTLWRCLQESDWVKRNFWVHLPNGSTVSHRIEVAGSFDEYAKALNKSTRKSIRRYERKLADAVDDTITTICAEGADSVQEYLRLIEPVASRSWQAGYEDLDLGPGSPEAIRVREFAERGWLRAYALKCGAKAIAYEVGIQADGVYEALLGGYDPAWAEYRPGNVLQLRIVEDLFTRNPPRVVDFGFGDHQWKRSLGTHVRREAEVYLVRRSLRCGVQLAAANATAALNRVGRRAAAAMGVLSAARRRLRR